MKSVSLGFPKYNVGAMSDFPFPHREKGKIKSKVAYERVGNKINKIMLL